ncbi:unnamed protein product [marine sediment metagenome]|uniref:Uncharacterized protein n=1 Tax=marine sediment metagenome TaxID=412755 RepID=X1TBV5_9ZZZZ
MVDPNRAFRQFERTFSSIDDPRPDQKGHLTLEERSRICKNIQTPSEEEIINEGGILVGTFTYRPDQQEIEYKRNPDLDKSK